MSSSRISLTKSSGGSNPSSSAAGLKHIDIRSHAGDQYYNADKQGIHSNNAMFHGGSRYLNDRTSTKINPQQIQWIYNSYKRDLLNLN